MDKRYEDEKTKYFDFGVIVYNQQDVVIQTLESIKYQVENYGKNYKCRLIIGDDCSKDRTTEYCEKWVEENKELFSYAIVVKSEKNKGTVENYLNVLNKIESPYFKIMDGDDIFSDKNIFELFEDISDSEFVTCIPFGIDENGKYKDVINDFIYFSMLDNSSLLKLMEYQNLFVSGFVFLNKEMIKESTIDFMKNFCLLEDHSMYYEILMRTKSKIRFSNEPYIFYRIRNMSVSHGNFVNKVYLEDCKKMCRMMLDKANTFYARLYLKLKLLSYNSRFVFFQPIRYWGKVILWHRKYVSRHVKSGLSQEIINRELEHFDYIKKRAQIFIEAL